MVIELGHLPAGNYVESSKAIYWDGRTDTGEQVSSGTYFCQIQAGDYTETRKMVILKLAPISSAPISPFASQQEGFFVGWRLLGAKVMKNVR